MNRRVVVTGIGLVSSLGIGTEATWEALCAGRSGVARKRDGWTLLHGCAALVEHRPP